MANWMMEADYSRPCRLNIGFPSHRFVCSGRHATLSCCLKHDNACGITRNKLYARVSPAVHAAPAPKRTLWEYGLRHCVTSAQAEPLDYDASSSQVLLSETGVHHRGPSTPNRAPCNHPCVRSSFGPAFRHQNVQDVGEEPELWSATEPLQLEVSGLPCLKDRGIQ